MTLFLLDAMLLLFFRFGSALLHCWWSFDLQGYQATGSLLSLERQAQLMRPQPPTDWVRPLPWLNRNLG